MNQKLSKYFLIGGATLVWGLIVVRVVKGLKGNDPLPALQKKVVPVNYALVKDSFEIGLNYPDPFLDNPVEAETEESATADEVQPIPKIEQRLQETPTFDISSIQFHGMIYNPEKRKKVAMITIGGNDYLAKENEKISEVKISKITADNIRIFVNGKHVEIARKVN